MNWLLSNLDLVWQLTLDHIVLSAPPIVAGFLLSLPLGWLANRRRVTRGTLLSIGGILYAIPSLPLFVLMPSLIGTKILDPINVVVALTIYALALMVRTTADALASVDQDVRQSSTAIGYSAWGRFWQVELPLAGPVLLAGLRVVSVSTVSLVSVGAVVGVNSLGYLFLNGQDRDFPEEIFIGIVGSVIVAYAFDLALVAIGRLLMPWTRPGRRERRPRAAAAAGAVGAS